MRIVIAVGLFALQGAKVEVKVDVSQAPELAEWSAKAKSLCEEWYPKIAETLKTENWAPPKEVTLHFDPTYKGVAATSGNKIRISPEWLKKRPDDFGMVVHELTHVVQGYPRGGPGWVTEGIADYVRYVQYEKRAVMPQEKRKGSYTAGYWPAASFLAWMAEKHDPMLIQKLNAAMRSGKWSDTIWNALTGKELDALWKDYLAG
jgi:hypothetical protein